MSLFRKLASQTAIYGLASIIGRLINWGLTPLYVNLFRPTEFGIFSDLYALAFYPMVILTFGMETAFFRFSEVRTSSQAAYANAFWAVTYLAISFGLITGIYFREIAAFLGYPYRSRMVLLLIGIIVLDVLSAMPLARLRYSEQAARFAAINLINVLLTLGLNLIFLLAMRLGIEYALVANFIASAIRLAMVVQDNLPDHIIPQNKFFAPMLGYGFYIMLAGLAGAVNEMLSRNMLPRLWPDGALYHSVPRTGLELNGIFSAAYKLGMFITLFTQAFRYAVEPIFFKQSGQKDSPRIFATITHYYGLAGLTGFVLIASFSYEIVSFNFWGLIRRTLIPKEYWIGLEAVPLILLANIAFGLYLNMAFWFKLTGQLRFGLLFALAGAIITVMLNFLTIPYFAYMGCAVTSVICYTAMCWLCYNTGQKYYPIPYRWRRLIVYSVIFGIIYLINSRLSYPYIYDQWPITFLKMILCALGIIFVYLIESRKPFITLFHEEIFNIDASNNTKNTIKGNIRRK